MLCLIVHLKKNSSRITFADVQAVAYYDFYDYAKTQNLLFRLDLLSFYLICLYFIKYFQLLPAMQTVINSMKKAALEFIMVILSLVVVLFGMTFITYFTYSNYLQEHKTFIKSMVTNVKMFLFNESVYLAYDMLNLYRGFSVFIILFFLFFLRFFLFNHFQPILIDYFKLDYDRIQASDKAGPIMEEVQTFTISQSKTLF